MANTAVRRMIEFYKTVPPDALAHVDAYLVGALASHVDEATFNQCAELAVARIKETHPDRWPAT